MAFYYKVPAIYEYEEDLIEIGPHDRINWHSEEIVTEKDGSQFRKVQTDKVKSIHPDFPQGINFTCALVDDKTFIVKTNKEINVRNNPNTKLIREDTGRESRDLEKIEPKEAVIIDRLSKSYSRVVRR